MSAGELPAPGRATAAWADTLLAGAGALLLYLALAQEALHGLDVHVHVYFLTQGHLELPTHVLYMKVVGALWPLLRELGMGPHHALRLLSALGMAAGVMASHRAALRLLADRGRAALVAALCAVPAAVVFFATVPEIHGVYAAFAGLAWWAWTALLAAPGVRRALLLGAALGVASSVHATGHLQVALVLLLGRALWRDGAPRAWLLAAVVVATHVAVAGSIAALAQPGRLGTPLQGQLEFVWGFAVGASYRLEGLVRTARDEWLLPFLPLSLASLAALARPAVRRLALATVAGLGLYLLAAFLLLDDLQERGAYLLPLALPFALLTLHALGARGAAIAGALALAWAVAEVRAHDHVDTAGWVAGLRAVVAVEPAAVICRDVPEQEQITRAVPDIPFVRVDSLLAAAERGDATYADFCGQFDALVEHYRGKGRSVLITRAAYETMAGSGLPFFARFLEEHLADRYALTEVARGGFAAYRVRPR